MESIAILGASRGLGKCIAEILIQKNYPLLLMSRHVDELMCEPLFQQGAPKPIFVIQDFTKTEAVDTTINKMNEFNTTRILYIAGGGPHGEYASKEWKDHLWAWKVSFLFPAEILHKVLAAKKKSTLPVTQILFVGSSIAENSPDPGAASYASGKHALKGLVTSLQKESTDLDIRLFSPGYMDTKMLPPNAAPRLAKSALVADPLIVATNLVDWMFDPKARNKCT